MQASQGTAARGSDSRTAIPERADQIPGLGCFRDMCWHKLWSVFWIVFSLVFPSLSSNLRVIFETHPPAGKTNTYMHGFYNCLKAFQGNQSNLKKFKGILRVLASKTFWLARSVSALFRMRSKKRIGDRPDPTDTARQPAFLL